MENGENFLAVIKYEAWAKQPSHFDDQSAYMFATQSLIAISVDVVALESRHQPVMSQQHLNYPRGSTNYVSLPIPYVKWGDTNSPAMEVTMLGTTREIMEIRMSDSSFSRRPSLLITNVAELQSTPDPPSIKLQPRRVSPGDTNVAAEKTLSPEK